jgi:glycine/D-amino acid oxidase-like deaminating enzyme
LERKLGRFSRALGRLGLGGARSGLRTMTPDGRFVVGEDPRRRRFYWVAGLGGHGVTTCFSVGKLAADMIMGRTVDKKLQKALSPRRFIAC